jgi:hypothetical protein
MQIERFNGSCSFGKNIWLSNREIKLYTDSAGNPELGCGEYFSGRWTFFQWLPDWRYSEIMADITSLELVPNLCRTSTSFSCGILITISKV